VAVRGRRAGRAGGLAAMAGIGGTLAQGCYGMALAVNMLWVAGAIKLTSFLPLGTLQHQQLSLFLLQTCWRIALLFAPWIRFQPDEDYLDQWTLIVNMMAEHQAEAREKGQRPSPLFVIANHTSFLDTILGVAKFPTQIITKCRTYMDHHLFKLPVLATICRAIGHFPVYFKSDGEGHFQVDLERMKDTEKKVDAHLANGGWICFFPEGTMNKNPDKLLPFRYGGMKKAIQEDARIAIMVFHNNPGVWPRKCLIGGFPGKVRYNLKPLAPFSVKEFLAMARAEGAPEEKDMKDHEILARRLQELMQAQYDSLAKDAEKEARGKDKKRD